MAKVTKRSRKFKSREQTRAKRGLKQKKKTKVFARGTHVSKEQDVPSKSKKSTKVADESREVEAEDDGFANMESVGIDELLSGDFLKNDDDEDGDGDDEDDDDDIAEGEEEEAMAKHMKELGALKETDPSFYEHLMKNEKSLLEFGVGEDEDETDMAEGEESDGDGDSDGDGAEEEAEEASETPEPAQSGRITMSVLKTLRKQVIEKGSFRGLLRLARIYRYPHLHPHLHLHVHLHPHPFSIPIPILSFPVRHVIPVTMRKLVTRIWMW